MSTGSDDGRLLMEANAPSRLRSVAFWSIPPVLTILAAGSMLPLGAWWAGSSPQSYRGAWQTWAWGACVVVLVVVLLLILSRGRAPELMLGLGRKVARIPAPLYLCAVALVLGAATALVSAIVFVGNPRSVDGFAHLFQARIFLSGHVWAPPPPEPANFSTLHMIVGPDRWYSQYPPGQSVLLAAGMKLGAWWLLNPLVTILLVVATYRVALWCGGTATARIAAILVPLSPFVVATSASEMNHLPAAALGMAAAACACCVDDRNRALPAAGIGVALGLMTAFRPLDAVAAALPVLAVILIMTPRPMLALGTTAVTGALASIPTLAYNAATTGSWRTFGYTALWGPDLRLGFHPVPWGVPLTPLRAVGLTGQDLFQLNTYGLDLPVPMLAVIAVGFLLGRRAVTSRDVVPVTGILGLSAILFFYWHRDVFYGPRFLFSVFPWYLILLSRALVLATTAGRAGTVSAFAVVVGLLVGSATITPARFRAYRTGTAAFDFHPAHDAREAGIGNAVVLIPDGWGSRLIARMWDAGVPVPISTRLYTAIDACHLQVALDDARNQSNHRKHIVATLDSLARLGRPGVPLGVTEDRNLRLIPGDSIAPACQGEIAFDAKYGILAFAPYLYLNSPTLDGDIVWARDLGQGNGPLLGRYPHRRFYRYALSNAGDPRPVFLPLDPAKH